MKTKLGVLAVAALSITACSHGPLASNQAVQTEASASEKRQPANQRLATLPDQAQWQSLYDYADALDLTQVELALHTGNGTSVYGVVSIGGKPIGAVIPEGNSSGSITGETIAFTISRALGVSDIYQPGIYKQLTGRNLDAFMAIVPRTVITNKSGKVLDLKEANRKKILSLYAKDPSHLDSVFKRWDVKPKDVDGISKDGLSLSPAFTVAGARAPLASFLQCNGPRPDPSRKVTFAGGTSDELSVAKQLSAILLIDAMTQQRDRFSGGNLQTITKDGVAKFASIDNGGTWGGGKADPDLWTRRNLSSVTRWDRNVAEQILGMADLIERGRPYLGLRNEAELIAALDITEASPDIVARFKRATVYTANHIRQHANCYF